MLATIIQSNRDKVIELCQKYKVLRLFVFGSASNGNFNPNESDIDLIAELESMPAEQKGELIIKLWNELEGLFKRKIDLITNPTIKNPYLKKEIENSKVLLYERKG